MVPVTFESRHVFIILVCFCSFAKIRVVLVLLDDARGRSVPLCSLTEMAQIRLEAVKLQCCVLIARHYFDITAATVTRRLRMRQVYGSEPILSSFHPRFVEFLIMLGFFEIL